MRTVTLAALAVVLAGKVTVVSNYKRLCWHEGLQKIQSRRTGPKAQKHDHEGIRGELGKAALDFYVDKFRNLDKLCSWKREFMIAVFDILVNNSYLAKQMQAISKEGAQMPLEVLDILGK